MNEFGLNTIGSAVQKWVTSAKEKLYRYGLTLDVWVFVFIIGALNPHLMGRTTQNLMIFVPSAVGAGEWWRIVTHPFVHVTWYHLLLDAGAFLLLYTGLDEKRMVRKILYAMICGGFSLMAALMFSPWIESNGLCGLSGTAHGLMAYSGLEMMHKKRSFRIGLITFLAVTLKSIYEFASGEVVFAFMHMDLCGIPLAPCHIGGVIGGIIAFFMSRQTVSHALRFSRRKSAARRRNRVSISLDMLPARSMSGDKPCRDKTQ